MRTSRAMCNDSSVPALVQPQILRFCQRFRSTLSAPTILTWTSWERANSASRVWPLATIVQYTAYVRSPSGQTIGTLRKDRLNLVHAAYRTGTSEEKAGFEAAMAGLLMQKHDKKTQTFCSSFRHPSSLHGWPAPGD